MGNKLSATITDTIIPPVSASDQQTNTIEKTFKIASEFKKLLKNYELEGPAINNHRGDSSGKSKVNQLAFWFSNDDIILAECYDWSAEIGYYDNLKINILSDEVNRWLSGR